MGNLGFREILVILLIVVILFGAKRIPELMRGMGQGVKEFKAGMKDEGSDSRSSEEKKDAIK